MFYNSSMRLNKSFIIPRSGSSKREIYQSLNLVSEFIFNKVKVENESIWIAQREGRARFKNAGSKVMSL